MVITAWMAMKLHHENFRKLTGTDRTEDKARHHDLTGGIEEPPASAESSLGRLLKSKAGTEIWCNEVHRHHHSRPETINMSGFLLFNLKRERLWLFEWSGSHGRTSRAQRRTSKCNALLSRDSGCFDAEASEREDFILSSTWGCCQHAMSPMRTELEITGKNS